MKSPSLHKLGLGSGQAVTLFERLCPNWLEEAAALQPSEYVARTWQRYENDQAAHGSQANQSLNGKFFELTLATLLIGRRVLPIYLGAKVAFVPNIVYDLILYVESLGPVCISAKTSLRERYKQADLEAVALKFVHRRARYYLVTLSSAEAGSLKQKLSNGELLGVDKVVLANQPELNALVEELEQMRRIESPRVSVIDSAVVVREADLSGA
ncbi:MAG: hypothetical protein NZL91_03255 [Thermoflexales bacterium]|nr:hypothetical protein [Thermoflexales bacterium]MCS7325333.1 hypothetical protein [Thermoflexales bacterium]MCX7939755.1 hypothetical protein [Thermoflexales bacterium]MDW8292949.1 hypothetical protein [Anaerolineae bacterium]